MLLKTARFSSFFQSQLYHLSQRNKHFLADVPLKRRGVDGHLSVSDLEGKLLLLYFSAGWCGSCKLLTPKLKKFHDGLGEEGKKLEVVWVSRDREADHQLEYYEKAMPAWAYIPFGDPNIKNFLEKYEVKTIPSLKLVDSEGNVLSDRVRADVEGCVKENPLKCFNSWKSL
ncbi:unnamed protein product [Auanema sp. JU1783]|nr:unnamed protein product [Auanema sp. JU1783]